MDIMVDLETLATSPDAAILSIGAVKFNPLGNGVDLEEHSFYAKVDLDSCDHINLTIHNDTIEWWSKQSKEAQEEAFSTDGRESIVDVFDKFHKFCWNADRIWSNGAGFDVVICETVFSRLHKPCPWEYWKVRDVRTVFDEHLMGFAPVKPDITAHNALIDAYNQAVGVQGVLRKLRGIE